MTSEQPRVRYVVISKDGNKCYGIYRSFVRADGDARAIAGYVLPVTTTKELS